jgi:putative nucleotidyltransferase with HDIG domain
MSRVEEILADIKHVPSAPQVLQKVLSLVNDPEFSYLELMEIIQLDPGLTAHVLRMANSAYFNLTNPVSSLQQALTYLGVKNIVDVVMSSEVVGFYKKSQNGYIMERGELWRHSMACALLARKMGEDLEYPDTSTLFTAALLHDIGKIVLSQYVGEEFEKIEKLVSEHGKDFVAAEREVLGLDHAVLGAKMAQNWKLPPPIIRAIAYHHAPFTSPGNSRLVQLVAMSNLVVIGMGVGGGVQGLAVPAPDELLTELNFTSQDLQKYHLQVGDILSQADELLRMAD